MMPKFPEPPIMTRVARKVGTPFYAYSADLLRQRYGKVARAFRSLDPLICYSVKANSNLAVLRLLAREGSGFDIVSEGELYRARKAGVRGQRMVFAGVGKTEDEIDYALREKVYLFNVEAEEELPLIDRLARRRGVRARVAIRVNPDVDPKTHKYITTGKRENKFGLDPSRARALLRRATRMKGVHPAGIHIHIGSQVMSPRPFLQALNKISPLFSEFPDGRPEALDLGGGFGISYEGKKEFNVGALARALTPKIRSIGCRLILEPGRFIAGPAGALVTQVLRVKPSGKRHFFITDAGMTELIRPPLYSAYHRVTNLNRRAGTMMGDVVGPICETADFLARDVRLSTVKTGDLLAVLDAGAYGFTMASHYNSRPNPPEVLITGKKMQVVRKRETLADLIRGER